MRIILTFIITFLIISQQSYAQDFSLESGRAKLTVVKKGKKKYAVTLSYKGQDYGNYLEDYPISLEVDSSMITLYYSEIDMHNHALTGRGVVKTKRGSLFEVTDIYTRDDSLGSFLLNRKIDVLKAHADDRWFNSYFGITNPRTASLEDYDFFVPGIWYKDNDYLPDYALASDYNHNYFYFREDRLPLPVAMWRNKKSGITLSLTHDQAVPETFWGEFGRTRIISEQMQFGSLGFRQKNSTAAVFMFPGAEGEKTYVRPLEKEAPRWAFRSHPVEEDVRHDYQLVIRISTTGSFPEAVRETWESAYNRYDPAIHAVNMQKVYHEEIKLLNAYWANINNAAGWPFSIYLPNGVARAYNYQMGFIGMQLPNAYYLIRNGLESGNDQLLAKGSLVVDFWAENSLTEEGLPKTWADAYVDRKHTWRDYPTYMRVAGDGMEGALNAWNIMQKHNIDKPEWLAFCEKFGEWLVENQNEDGSYFIRYDWRTGEPTHESKYTTTNVIRYLVRLSYATGEQKYLETAIRAGDFSYDFIHDDYLYVGGVIDNPNVKDRESGQQAIYAFLALYDATQDKKWLNAAVQAAHYTETFMYAYNIPMALNDTLTDFPHHKKTTGQTLIATGHSAVDNGFSFSSFQYYRLYLFTGDKHFLNVAKMIMYNSLQTMDLDGKMGYAYPALQSEAFTLTPPRGHSVRQWLPWNTAAVMDPLHRFMDAFGIYDIQLLEKLPREQQVKRNREFARTLGIIKKMSK